MKLATIERVLELNPIEGADKIVLAKILGWDVVVKKDEFAIGDFCVYIPIDTQVDPSQECFNFLASPKDPTQLVRIKTTKLRGVWSQGLALPVQCLGTDFDKSQLAESVDVSEKLGVKKYEKETIITVDGTTTKFISFPNHLISRTDEDNLKSNYKALTEFYSRETYITQKMDGSSMTLILNKSKEEFLVCSRNLVLEPDAVMYQYVEQAGIKNLMENYGKSLAIQGEFCGPKVNGNAMGLKSYEFYVFTVKNLDTGLLYGFDEIKAICADLGLKMVPVVGTFNIDDSWNINKFQQIANEQEYIQSNGKKVPGEGIVIRPCVPVFSPSLGKILSVKIINQNYKD